MSSKNQGTYLDPHANMVVCGKYCPVLSQSGINATVPVFTNDVGTIQLPIMDTVRAYDCHDTSKCIYRYI